MSETMVSGSLSAFFSCHPPSDVLDMKRGPNAHAAKWLSLQATAASRLSLFHSLSNPRLLSSLRILNRRRDVAQNAAPVGCRPHLFL